jgi:hypothetical protein
MRGILQALSYPSRPGQIMMIRYIDPDFSLPYAEKGFVA